MADPATLAAIFGTIGAGGGGAAAAGAGIGSTLGTLGTLATTGLALSSAFKSGPKPPPPTTTPPVPPSLYQQGASNFANTAAKAASAQNQTIGTSTQGDKSIATTAKPGLKTTLGQ